MRTALYVAIYLLSSAPMASEFDQYLDRYNEHQKMVKSLSQEIQIFKLRSDAQKLKTKLQKDRLECQKFGGCQTKTLYTPLHEQNAQEGKANKKQQRDQELQAVLNKPLPRVTGIINNLVSFDNSPQQFKVGDVVYGVWQIKSISATTVKLRNKDNDEVKTIYFYW